MPSWRWVLTDATNSSSYQLHVNPNAGGTPSLTKSITYEASAAPDGATLAFEGRDSPRKIEVSGVILEQAHLEALELWAAKRHPVTLTDDLARVFDVYIESFEPTRVRKGNNPWYHTYSLKMLVVS